MVEIVLLFSVYKILYSYKSETTEIINFYVWHGACYSIGMLFDIPSHGLTGRGECES